MIEFNKSEYLLGVQNIPKNLTGRQFLNLEFLKVEDTNIKRIRKWYNQYLKAKEGDSLEEVNYYCLPARASGLWKENEELKSQYQYKGLSALRNNPQIPIIGLFPKEKRIPDYSFIRIIQSKKKILFNKNLPQGKNCEFAIIIEEFEELPIEKIYEDLPFEKRRISSLFLDNLGGDKFLSQSLAIPLLSAPASLNVPGGISYASLAQQTHFLKELFKSVELATPPELRLLSLPPKSYQKEEWIAISSMLKRHSIEFKFAEKILNSKNKISLTNTNNYNIINKELDKKNTFKGEYSFISGISSRLTNKEELVRKFTKTHITTTKLTELGKDIDILKFRKELSENIWYNIIATRQFFPKINDKKIINEYENKIKEDWGVHLSEMGEEENEIIKKIKAETTTKNVIQIAQANARDQGREQIIKEDLKYGRYLFNSSMNEFTEHHLIPKKEEQKKNKELNKITLIKVCLESKNFTEEELWFELKESRYFQNQSDFQNILKELHKSGIIYQAPNGWSWS
ncbi:MAG: hypothetical protein ACOCQQ_00250 [Candidatus Nanoarchaeia archaeon]